MGTKVLARISLSRNSKHAVNDKVNIENVKDPSVEKAFQTQLNKNLKDLAECGNLTQMWDRQMKIIQKTSLRVVGKMQLKKKKTRFDQECKIASLKTNYTYKGFAKS